MEEIKLMVREEKLKERNLNSFVGIEGEGCNIFR